MISVPTRFQNGVFYHAQTGERLCDLFGNAPRIEYGETESTIYEPGDKLPDPPVDESPPEPTIEEKVARLERAWTKATYAEAKAEAEKPIEKEDAAAGPVMRLTALPPDEGEDIPADDMIEIVEGDNPATPDVVESRWARVVSGARRLIGL